MKSREERRKILIRAQMRSGTSWADVCILNLSASGAGLQCAQPPPRGTYVELRRGAHVIAARVMWSKGHRFGIKSQDPLHAIACSTTESIPGGLEPQARKRPTKAEHLRHEHSRHLARAAQFATIALVTAAAAIMLCGTVESALAHPLTAITGALKGRAPR